MSNEFDWGKVREVLCGIASALEEACQTIPPGNIKNIVCGIASVLELICNQLPAAHQSPEK
jgi:hypothetical protein